MELGRSGETRTVNVISRTKLKAFSDEHPDAAEPLDAWFRIAKRAQWRKYADLKADYRGADVVGKYTAANIGGNKIRLILEVFYESNLVLVRHVLTHEDYDTNRWRADAREPKPGRRDSSKSKTPKKPPGKES